MEIIQCVEKSRIVKNYIILVLEVFEGGFYIKIRALLTNNTELYIREYSDINERNYSYHWQSADGKMIMRWDNANHHKNIDTYPHHVHHTDTIHQVAIYHAKRYLIILKP